MTKINFFLFFSVLVTSCTKIPANFVLFDKIKDEKKIDLASEKVIIDFKNKDVLKKETLKKESDFSKVLREALYFSSSLEREALKLISKNNSLQKMTLFSILSYVAEIKSGVKKATPFGLDCSKFDIKRERSFIKISKLCTKPAVQVAQIKILEEDKLYDVEFFIKEWERVVGMSVTLTGDNMLCNIKIKDKKLYTLKCDNWSYQMESGRASVTVIKTNEFLFQRDAQKQFVIRGGFFKEMMENKKIDISVPLHGKIKIFEKEIKIMDQYADEVNSMDSNANASNKINSEEIGLKNEEKNEEKNDKKNENNNQDGQVANQNINQDLSQEAHQQGHQEISQDNTQGEIGNEFQNTELQNPEAQNPEVQNSNPQTNPEAGEIDFGVDAGQQNNPTGDQREHRGR